jgi:hypothetical protein
MASVLNVQIRSLGKAPNPNDGLKAHREENGVKKKASVTL